MAFFKALCKVETDLSHPKNVSTVVRLGNDSESNCVASALDRVKDRYGAKSEQMVN